MAGNVSSDLQGYGCCIPGYSCPVNLAYASLCPSGTYSSVFNASNCIQCNSSTYSPNSGATTCLACAGRDTSSLASDGKSCT